MLGSLGLAFILLRNVMERRSELALLQAIGFTRESLCRMLLYEHMWLLVMGMACGVISAMVAVIPAFRALGTGFPLDFPWFDSGCHRIFRYSMYLGWQPGWLWVKHSWTH